MRWAVSTGRAFRYLAGAVAALTVIVGVTVRIIDPKDFHSVGDGLWWAIVTLGTVGYGDIVPTTTWGRLLGSVVIIFGVTFIAFLTATVTSLFVSANQEEHADRAESLRNAYQEETTAMLRELLERVGALEDRLQNKPPS